MEIRRFRILAALAVILALVLSVVPAAPVTEAHGLRFSDLSQIQKRILSSAAFGMFENDEDPSATPSNYFPSGDDGCPRNYGDNIKVNQNCIKPD